MAAGQALAAAAAPACSGVMIMPAVADPGVAIYVPALMMLNGRGPERLRVLSMAPVEHRIENVTRSGFDLAVLDRAREWTLWERVYRRRPLPAGTRVVIGSLDATVLEDAGGVPTRLRFDFGEPLDSPHLCFYQWRNSALVRLRVPRPGDAVHLGYEWGPGGM
jgi:hypothetical protein